MKDTKTALLVLLLLLCPSMSCKLLREQSAKTTPNPPTIDFTTPGNPVNVTVVLDKKQTASEKISTNGGTVSLTSADGSKFTLEVPPGALDTETTITMTAVKSMDGAPLDSKTPTAVQLEPSGLFFNELVTLTVVPAKAIPIKEQIIFGYEGDGKDYHLAVVDPKSKDIKIKLIEFSGAGVASASDAAWAGNLQVQAAGSRTRLMQKAGELTRAERMRNLLGDESGSEEWGTKIKSMFEQWDEQVIRKSMVSAELDCRFARQAIRDLLATERMKQLLGHPPDMSVNEKTDKLVKIGEECQKPAAFQIVGGLDDFQTSTKVCDIMQPFTLTGGGFKNEFSGGLSGTYKYTGPFQSEGSGTYTISLPEGLDKPGTMTGQGSGSVLGKYTGSGTEKYTLTPIPPCG